MFNYEVKFPSYKSWKASFEKYTEQLQKFYKDFWNDIWINYPKNDS